MSQEQTLRECRDYINRGECSLWRTQLLAKIDAALAAPAQSRDEMLKYYSDYANVQANEALAYQKRIRELEAKLAAPAQAADKDERAAFEAWATGERRDLRTLATWEAWQARVALAAVPQPAERRFAPIQKREKPKRVPQPAEPVVWRMRGCYYTVRQNAEDDKKRYPEFRDTPIEPLYAAPAATVPAEPSKRDEAYDQIDRFLRNNLSDMDYADYSQALDLVWEAPAATVQPALTDEQILARGKFHFRPGENGEPDDWDWYDADITCDTCVDAVIVRADALLAASGAPSQEAA